MGPARGRDLSSGVVSWEVAAVWGKGGLPLLPLRSSCVLSLEARAASSSSGRSARLTVGRRGPLLPPLLPSHCRPLLAVRTLLLSVSLVGGAGRACTAVA